MSTQFVSKNSNYMVVLKNGIEGNRILGTQPISGIYIKFEGGIVTVKEESIAEMLRQHPGFGSDFIEVKEDEKDPFIDTREETEPTHVISEIKYGHVEKSTSTAPKVKMTPQMKDFIKAEAVKMLPDLLKDNPQILKDIIVNLANEMKAKEVPEESSVEEKIEVPTPKVVVGKKVISK